MLHIKRFITTYPFVAIPALFVFATICMDVTMYVSMGLAFPKLYFFSIIVMLTICGLLFFIKKPAIQYGICIFLLCVHYGVALANIVIFKQTGEIASVETLSGVRQVVSLTDFIVLDLGYMLIFSFILFAFICVGIWTFSVLNHSRRDTPLARAGYYKSTPYKRNTIMAVATLAITAYMTGFLYNFALPPVNTNSTNAFDNYTNDRFVYTTFSNRVRILSSFGTYSYYWSNISFVLGIKNHITYDIEDNWVDDFTFDALPDHKQNVIMLQMETLERSLVHPIVMPNLYNFLYTDSTAQNIADIMGYYSIDRTCITEYASLAGTHLEGVEMNTLPYTMSPYSLPHILGRTEQQRTSMRPYESIKAFHNYLDFMYNRDIFFDEGMGFKSFVSFKEKNSTSSFVEDLGYPPYHNLSALNRNSDYQLFSTQAINMAPSDKKFFSFVENVSTHSPYYDANLFDYYTTSGNTINASLPELKNTYANLSNSDQRTADAVKSFLTAANEYDRGLGVLFNHLRNTDALDEDGNPMYENGNRLKLIDTTTILFYSDHTNQINSDLLAPVTPDPIYNPEKASGQGRLLAFYIYSPLITQPTTIHKFMSYYDIYATACDLLHIKINTKYTLGISVFNETHENVGFSTHTALVFNDKFATYDFKTYLPGSYTPREEEIQIAKERASHIIAVMNNMRPKYRTNTLRDIPETFYYIETSDTP